MPNAVPMSDAEGFRPPLALQVLRSANDPKGSTMSDQDHVQISARIPADLAKQLEQRAEEEDRTFSAELRRAIRQYLARNE